MFSKACEYGIRATIQIGHESKEGRRIGLKALAKAIDSPEAFTSKILQALARDGIINSIKGPNGGYEMIAKKNNPITLLHIVKAIDGNKIYNGCGLGLKQCNASKPCPLHHQFATVRDELKKMLQTTTIEDLTIEMLAGEFYLKR